MDTPDEYTSAPAIFHPIKRYLTENEASRGSRISNAVSKKVLQGKKKGFVANLFTSIGKNLPASTWDDPNRWKGAYYDVDARKQWKHLVRKGIPNAVRYSVWREMVQVDVDDGGAQFEAPFTVLLTKQFGSAEPALFKYPTFGSRLPLLAQNQTLQLVCFVLHVLHPQVGYAPLLPPLCALLIDARYTPDEICRLISVLVATQTISAATKDMLARSMQRRRTSVQDFPRTMSTNSTASSIIGPHDDPPFTHVPLSAINSYTFCKTLYLLVQESFPLISTHLESVFGDEELPYYALVDTFFETFPMEIRLRVLDSLLNEGYKIIYRYVLAVLHMQRKTILGTRDKAVIAHAIHFPATESLPKLAFSTVHLSRSHVHSQSSSPAPTPRGSPQRSDKRTSRGPAPLSHLPHHPSRSLFAQTMAYLRPHLSGASQILDDALWQALWRLVPPNHANAHAQKLFDAHTDGYRLRTLLDKVSSAERRTLLLVVENQDGVIMGAWIDKGLEVAPSGRFGGSEETFLLTLRPAVQKYDWVCRSSTHASPTKDDSLFVMATHSELAIGGGGTGYGLHLDEELQGSSAPCATFGNAGNLVDGGGRLALFKASNVEVWALHPH